MLRVERKWRCEISRMVPACHIFLDFSGKNANLRTISRIFDSFYDLFHGDCDFGNAVILVGDVENLCSKECVVKHSLMTGKPQRSRHCNRG